MKKEFKIKFNSASKVVSKSKLLTISPSLANSLRYYLRQMLYLSFGKKRMLLIRSRQAYDFLSFLNRMKNNHGVDFTVSWMKACYVALQKSLGQDPLGSLRDLQPDLPMPRLINGVPYIIKSRDRDRIRKGDRSVIIFWSSLFSIYRILKVSYKLKFSTITDPFKGDRKAFDKVLIYSFHPFARLEGYDNLVRNSNLAPRRIPLLRAASATNTVSWHGLFTDAVGWFSDPKMFPVLQEYYLGLQSLGWNTLWIEEKILEMSELGSKLSEKSALRSKCSMVAWFGQFSLKEEAAGKLRIFAIVDSISQTMLLPLHQLMLGILRLIPNDGTFDQDASVKRSQKKAIEKGKAYSFDLSAATDRLPVELTERMLSTMLNHRFARAWRRFMVERPFQFNQDTCETYDLPLGKEYFYSVGQPMGALSSWPALALTHHWILQYCSNVVLGRIGWETAYEILGDDLVVFDSELAEAYLEMCRILGIDINLSKSISSRSRPVFEFAKRTCWGEEDLSPISMKQLMANNSLSERITNVLSFLKRGLLVKKSLLGTIISKVADSSILNKSEMIFTPLLSILGGLRNHIPHRWLVEPLVNPVEDFEFEDSKGSLPFHQVINLVMSFNRSWVCPSSYPYSNEEIRKEIYDDYEPEFANVIANTALTQLKLLQNNLQQLIRSNSRELVRPYSIREVWLSNHKDLQPIPEDTFIDPLVLSQIEGWFDDLLFEDGNFDVDQAIEDFESFKPFYYRRLTLEDSEILQKKVESFLFHFTLSPKEHNVENREEEAKIMRIIDKVISHRPSSYFKLPLKEWELVN